MSIPLQDRLLTTAEAAEILGLSESALSTRRHRGSGPKQMNFGGSRTVRYRYSDLLEWAESGNTEKVANV